MNCGTAIQARALPVLALLSILATGPASAINRGTFKEIRGRYQGLRLRLRIDLRPANVAGPPNVVSRTGVGYARERAPVLFNRLEQVFIERVNSEGSRRLGLTVYRSEEEARQLRALAIPQPGYINPNAAGTLAAYARLGSTSVLLELETGRKDGTGQLREIEGLFARLFYIDSEPTRDEIESFIIQHRGAAIPWLRAVTGLDAEEVRSILDRAPDP
jgi:hypothetical protein